MASSYLFSLGRRKAQTFPRIARFTARFEGLLLGICWRLAQTLSPDRASAIGGKLFAALGPRLAKNKHVARNLSIAFPDAGDQQIRRLCKGVWRETGSVIAEFPHLERICGEQAETRLEVVDHYGMDRVVSGEKVAVFATAHYGNWELAAGVCRKVGFRLSVLHTSFANPKIESLLMRNRQALGCQFIPRQHGARGMIKALQGGRSVGVVMDQRYDEGELLQFFNRAAPTGTAAAAIANKFNIDFVPVRVERKLGAAYRITFFPAISPKTNLAPRDNARAMTAELLALFESWIRERPDHWMCLKRRWPKSD